LGYVIRDWLFGGARFPSRLHPYRRNCKACAAASSFVPKRRSAAICPRLSLLSLVMAGGWSFMIVPLRRSMIGWRMDDVPRGEGGKNRRERLAAFRPSRQFL